MRLFKRKATEEEVINIRKENQKLLGRIKRIEYSLENPPKFSKGANVYFLENDNDTVWLDCKVSSSSVRYDFLRDGLSWYYTVISDCSNIHENIHESRLKTPNELFDRQPKTKKS